MDGEAIITGSMEITSFVVGENSFSEGERAITLGEGRLLPLAKKTYQNSEAQCSHSFIGIFPHTPTPTYKIFPNQWAHYHHIGNSSVQLCITKAIQETEYCFNLTFNKFT